MAGRDSQLEKAIEVALAQIVKNPMVQPKHPVFPLHPGKQQPSERNLNLPVPSSAFPPPPAISEVKPVSDGKFAVYLGQFDTPMGVVVFQQEGDKLIGIAGNNRRIELIPDATAKDKFVAPIANVQVTFEPDSTNKIIGLTIVIPSRKELRGKKIN